MACVLVQLFFFNRGEETAFFSLFVSAHLEYSLGADPCTHWCYVRMLSDFLSGKNKHCTVFHMFSGFRSGELENILV